MQSTLQTFRAVFQDGVFIPQSPCGLAEGTAVELLVRTAALRPPQVFDPVERERLLNEVLRLMRSNPIPAGAERWTREELHERC